MPLLENTPFLPPASTLDGTEQISVIGEDGLPVQTTTADIAGLASANDADVLVKTANSGLSSERVVTDTSTIAVDWATTGQAKFGVVDSSLARGKLAAGNAGRWNVTVLTDGTYTVVDADVVLDGSALGVGGTNAALPPAASHPGRMLWVKCSATEDITLTPTAGTIAGGADVTLAGGAVAAMYVAVGTDWKNILSL